MTPETSSDGRICPDGRLCTFEDRRKCGYFCIRRCEPEEETHRDEEDDQP